MQLNREPLVEPSIIRSAPKNRGLDEKIRVRDLATLTCSAIAEV
jgi:hypothetical protein